MRFFEGIRPQIYLHGAKLRRDKKTGKRLWGLTLIVTLNPELVDKCCAQIEQAWLYLLTLDNQVDEVSLASIVPAMSIEFYALVDDRKPALRIQAVDFQGLRLTRDQQTVELWFQFEVENSATVHPFVKEYAFTRVWADFKERANEIAAEQARTVNGEDLKSAVLPALDDMTEWIRDGGIDSMTVQIAGQEPVVIDKAGAERIHEAAKKLRKGRKDPG